MRKELLENFYSKININKSTKCWEWIASLSSGGYGQFSFLGKTYKSHRMSYMLFKGYISDDKEIDHLCHNRKCCNPEHLDLVSGNENLKRRNSYRIGMNYNRAKSNLSTIDRLYYRMDIDSKTQCWNFNGTPDKDGYGCLTYSGKTYKIHRFSYLLFKGEIPPNYVIDHLCGNRNCYNPDHLEAVTQSENINRGHTGKKNNHQSLKSSCPNGHKYTPENTYINPKSSRECRICKTAHRKADRQRNLEKYRKNDRKRYLKKKSKYLNTNPHS